MNIRENTKITNEIITILSFKLKSLKEIKNNKISSKNFRKKA